MENPVLKLSLKHIIILSFFFSSFAVKAQISTASTDLSVMSFNVRTSNGKDGINNWENRKSLALKTLLKIKADVIGMQETTSEQFRFFKENLKGYNAYAVGRKDGKLEDEIMAIFYNDQYELLLDSTIWLSESPTVIGSKSWDAALYRTVSWLKLKEKDSEIQFMIYNTHLDHMGMQAREESAKLIMNLIAATSDGIPIVLMGDFNITKDEKPYKILTSKWKAFYQIEDAHFITEQSHRGGNTTFNRYDDNVRKIIDFIFVSDGVIVKSHQYLNIKEGEVFISDHYPVEATLEINNKKIYPNTQGKSME